MKFKLLYALLLCFFTACKGQNRFGTDHLKLVKTIALPGVSGRIDHIAVNLKDQVLYVAALGNNSVEVVDLQKGIVIKSIQGVKEPQGIAYIPQQNEIAVASGRNGDCVFFNAASFEVVAVIHLKDDADNIRYDSADRKIYVGYGNGGIALIDPLSHIQIGNVKLPAHPESFQLDIKNNRIYVNLPDDNSIAVIDLKDFSVINLWKTKNAEANFPMTLDTTSNHVLIGYRHPALLVCYDANSGQELDRTGLISDADDLFYLESGKEVYASGGGGSINIFRKDSLTIYKKIDDIPTRNGARTSNLIPSLRMYVLAEPARADKKAAIVVFSINSN